ncbi:MAG: sigma-70 family RNA polymerase sigma factor, partial [Anaerolineae bacterium]|nr:sigma-70 family RNA polymerase sigma factor [Anaerolineae bacterium]
MYTTSFGKGNHHAGTWRLNSPEPTLQETSEVQIAACLRGEQAAYSALYELYAAGVYRLCYNLLLNRDDAEDIAQDTFVYAFKNLRRYDASKAAFKTWLYTIAICRCRNLYRRNRVPLLDISTLLHNPLTAPKSESPEAAFAHSDARAALQRALSRLQPRLREALVLRYGHGLTYREIAEVMDCPPKTAESRVRLATEALG